MTAVLQRSIIRTAYQDGTPRLWGVCHSCGHIDELGARQASAWDLVSLCSTCEDDYCEVGDRPADDIRECICDGEICRC